MGMAEPLRELRALPDDELVRRHDHAAATTVVGVDYYLAELARRDQDRQTQAMVRYTLWIAVMTAVVTVATIVNVVVAWAGPLR
jgi:hypothetical protein